MFKIISKNKYYELLANEDHLKHNDEIIRQQNKELDLIKPNNDFYVKLLALILNNPQYQIYKILQKRNIEKCDTLSDSAVVIVLKNNIVNLKKEWFDEKKEAERKNPEIDFPDKQRELGGICLYALSREITKNDNSIMISEYNKYPFLDATFSIKGNVITIFINNLHSRCSNNDYRGNGYGTLLLNCLLEILELNPLYSFLDISIIIEGDLSENDIECDKDIEIRNSFYRNKGFDLDFTTEDEKNGTFKADFIDLIKVKRLHT